MVICYFSEPLLTFLLADELLSINQEGESGHFAISGGFITSNFNLFLSPKFEADGLNVGDYDGFTHRRAFVILYSR